MYKFLSRKFSLCLITLLYTAKLFAVCDNVTTSGTITGNQTGCGGFNPSAMINVNYPTGGTGTLEYQWQNSTDNVNWVNIAGATLELYDPTTITITTYYHRLERRSS